MGFADQHSLAIRRSPTDPKGETGQHAHGPQPTAEMARRIGPRPTWARPCQASVCNWLPAAQRPELPRRQTNAMTWKRALPRRDRQFVGDDLASSDHGIL